MGPAWKRGTWVGGQLISGACLGLAGPGLRQKRDRDVQGQQQGWETMACGRRMWVEQLHGVLFMLPTEKLRNVAQWQKREVSADFWELMKMTIKNGTHLTGALRRLHGKRWHTLLGTTLASTHPFLWLLPAPVTKPQALSQARSSQRFMI